MKRICIRCSNAHVKCQVDVDGNLPCRRCAKYFFSCEFPPLPISLKILLENLVRHYRYDPATLGDPRVRVLCERFNPENLCENDIDSDSTSYSENKGERIVVCLRDKAPPFALKMTKKSINRTLDIQGFRAALDAHFDTHQLSHTTNEARGTGKTSESMLNTLKAGVARS